MASISARILSAVLPAYSRSSFCIDFFLMAHHDNALMCGRHVWVHLALPVSVSLPTYAVNTVFTDCSFRVALCAYAILLFNRRNLIVNVFFFLFVEWALITRWHYREGDHIHKKYIVNI